jgi:uncharacterized protein YndB with AHSA1/START domain
MSREDFDLGPLSDVHRLDEGPRPTLVFVRRLRHPAEKVWVALTDPESLAAWAPLEPERLLDGRPVGRVVGQQAKDFGWDELHDAYARELGAAASTDP